MIKSNSQSNAGCQKEESFPKSRHKSCSRIKNLATKNFRKSDKELNRSFTFHNNSIKYKKQNSEDIGNYSWTLLNEEAKKEAEKEYEFCVNKNKYKIICLLRKYIKYFSNLKKKTYDDNYLNSYTSSLNTTKSIGTFSSSENITNLTNIFNNSSNSIHIYDDYNNGNIPFHTHKKKNVPLFINYVKMKEKPFNETFNKLKKNEEWLLQDSRIIYFLEKIIIFILNIFNKYNNETDEMNITHKLTKIENGKIIVISLYIQYKYELNKRITCIDMNEDIKKVHSNYITKYFSIDNSIPTSPIEDILTNLKSILDYTKNLEEDEEGNDNKLIEINKIQEKIKTCENILRTQNLNEVPVCKYRKFEKVYNMWCLDQSEKNDEINSFLSQHPNKKSVTSFFNMHSLLSAKFQDQYNDIYDWNADIELIYKRNIFISIGYKLLYPLGVLETNFNNEKLKNFLLKIYSLYNDLPYHNSFHAAQVAHFTKSMLFMLDLNKKISGIDEFCLHVSSLCHDVGHPGLNNFFLIKSENELALTYNDSNVLENYHCSLVFKTLKDPNCNIFANYPNNIFITCKKNIIRAILSTDMKNHFEYISTFRTNREFIDYENLSNEQLWQIFCLILKGSDIGHSTLEWKKHLEWTLKINEEFYLQGLLEKSLNMSKSFLCDTISIDKLAISQIDFLKHLCIPLFNELNYISKNNEVYNNCISAIENNIEQWEKNKNNQKNLGLQEKYQDDHTVEKIKF
ncbi:cGMP-specific 3' [Plasmodium yoelii yoelii]|uniref:Phosphodiesterase n=1 Tax=Plasmodium yoelii yoelii TaxID=73239 RepID=A0AAE9WL04_PLAYO|nr:cGMP-specific 3' [Plasmodium yoelii yoelii]